VKKIPYRDAIAMQPGVLEANRTQLVAATAQLREQRGEGAVVAIVGIGASYYTALAAVREFWKVGVRAFAVDVGQLWEDDFDIADVYIAISASGESLETVAAVERLRKRKQGLVVSVTAELDGTLTTMVDLAVACAQLEDSVPATTSYTGGLQALAFLSSAWEPEAATTRLEQQWAGVPAVLEELLRTGVDAVAQVADQLARVSHIDFVGTPDAAPGAAEGALLYREAPRVPGGAFESRAYLHGPMESLEGGQGIVIVGDESDDGIAVVLRQVRQIGCVAVNLTTSPSEPSGSPVTAVTVPSGEGRLIRAVYEMALLQLLSARSAEQLELTSGKFRYPQPQVKIKQALV
jgi:glucosamine 6-phosphate synthetase-like amidotransferase/phosphosugar isomerase protein